jgi:hypothetical protein
LVRIAPPNAALVAGLLITTEAKALGDAKRVSRN